MPLIKQIYQALYWNVLHHLRYFFIENSLNLKSLLLQSQGVTKTKRDEEVIISLTSMHSRFKTLHIALESLLEQSVKPDQIILWLADNLAQNIPDRILKLQQRGLKIHYCDDIKSYKKFFFTLKENPKAVLVTADDDWIYPRNWLSELLDSYRIYPNNIHCHRAHLITFHKNNSIKPYNEWMFSIQDVETPSLNLFPTNGAGTLFPPGSLPEETLNREIFLKICPTADDVWLKAMSLINNVKCRKVPTKNATHWPIKNSQDISLWQVNREGNDSQIAAVFSRYNVMSFFEVNQHPVHKTKKRIQN